MRVHIRFMSELSHGVFAAAPLESRATITVSGPDWRNFLQGLVTQDVETLGEGEARFAALLTPQGRLLYDLFLVGTAEGCVIDVARDLRAALFQRLRMYRLRAKVELTEAEIPVWALWGAEAAPAGWVRDPRVSGLGFRGYGLAAPDGAAAASEADYEARRFALGLPGAADWGTDSHYPIEANFDLLGGIDFKKGCFVGQETTSRMKRRGVVKNRMAPLAFDGAAPAAGSPVTAGGLRAGAVTSATEGGAMALLRLDRLEAGPLALEDGRPCRVAWPAWMAEANPLNHRDTETQR